MRLQPLIAICVCIVGSLGNAHAQQDRPYVVLTAPGKWAAQIPFEQVDVGSYGSWRPSAPDIASLEAALPNISKMAAVNWKSAVQIEHPRSYFRQYIGVSHRGARRVLINASCDGPPPYWHERLFIVTDGGTCFWQALYDPATKTFSDLTVNGRA